MSENCKDCIQVVSLRNDVDRLRDDVKAIYGRLGEVENTLGRKEEQIETIFNLLKDIKDSIKGINDKLGNLERKPADNAEKIKLAIITAISSGIIGTILGFIFSKK